MITIDLGTIEYYDEKSNQFEYAVGGIVRFEYSLKAVYDWEGKWNKPFLKRDERSYEEIVDFYMKMALDPIDERFMTESVMKTLSKYIGESHTATVFSSSQNGSNFSSKAKFYTAEELYAIMFSDGVPLEFENRNLNRLMSILKIISINSNSQPKKMSNQDIMRQNAILNAQRKAKLKSKG